MMFSATRFVFSVENQIKILTGMIENLMMQLVDTIILRSTPIRM